MKKVLLDSLMALLFLYPVSKSNANGTTRSGTISISANETERKHATSKIKSANNNIVLLIGGQSNEGTNPATGQTIAVPYYPPYINMTNIWIYNPATDTFDKFIYGTLAWGWIDQSAWILSQQYENVYIIKTSVGGTKLSVLTGAAAYPRTNFKVASKNGMRKLASIINITMCDKINLWGQCESDAILYNDALNYDATLLSWIAEYKAYTGIDNKWIIKQIGNKQKDFEYREVLAGRQQYAVSNNSSWMSMIKTDNLRMWGNDVGPLNYRRGDFSHYRSGTAVIVGNRYADAILSMFGRTKIDTTPPVLLTAIVPDFGDWLILKFNEPINPVAIPYYWQFRVGSKMFDSVIVNNNTIKLHPTVPFYKDQYYSFSYIANLFYEENIQDLYGNEIQTMPCVSLNNNTALIEPSLTTLYSSNFSNGVDGTWIGEIGDSVFAPSTSPSGVTDCMQVICSSNTGTGRAHKLTTAGISSGAYRLIFDIEVPDKFKFPANPSGFVYQVQTLFPTKTQIELKNLLIRDRMTHVEVQWISSGTNDDIILSSNGFLGDKYWIKNIVIQKLEVPAQTYTNIISIHEQPLTSCLQGYSNSGK